MSELDQLNEIPLFPLRAVLFPDGVLPLRIFEPRYIDMVRRCMRDEVNFGVVLIRDGSEVVSQDNAVPPNVFRVGTEAKIVDFNQADNGLLGIVARGGRKFQVEETYQQNDELLIGRVRFMGSETVGSLGEEHAALLQILKDLLQHPLIQQLNPSVDLEQALSVSNRLAELLPIEPEIKQTLLQMSGPNERLTELKRIVGKFRE
mgnify:FL=1